GPADQPGAYLKVLAGVSRLLSDERCRARLMEAENEAELLLVLRDEEARSRRAVRAAQPAAIVATPESRTPAPSGARPQIIVVTTAMLVFISYWRAAAIVLCDMASTVYYI